jgi:hypothetical protein
VKEGKNYSIADKNEDDRDLSCSGWINSREDVVVS